MSASRRDVQLGGSQADEVPVLDAFDAVVDGVADACVGIGVCRG